MAIIMLLFDLILMTLGISLTTLKSHKFQRIMHSDKDMEEKLLLLK